VTRPVRIPTTLDLQRHAYQLAAAFGVQLLEARDLAPDEALAIPGRRLAVVAPIVDETTYAVALHELGHLIAPLGSLTKTPGNRHNLTRDEEDAAWTWARRHALLWTDAMDTVARWAEGTYATPSAEEADPPAPVAPQRINWDDWE